MKIQFYQVLFTFILLLTLKHIAKNMFDIMSQKRINETLLSKEGDITFQYYRFR